MTRAKGKLTLVAVILALTLFNSAESESKTSEFRIRRIMRDTSGRFNPHRQGELAHRLGHLQSISVESHNHGHEGGVNSVSASSSSSSDGHGHGDAFLSSSSNGEGEGIAVSFSRGGYGYPPAPPPPVPVVETIHPHPCPPTHPIQPNCVCVQRGRCDVSLRDYTLTSVRTIETIVCGTEFESCCYPDPWPGVTDAFKHLAPCVPTEQCVHGYGTAATDVAYFGVIGPCPGLGTVRCMDLIAPNPSAIPFPVEEGPTHFVIPILPNLEPTPVAPVTPVVAPVPGGYNLPVEPLTSYVAPAPAPVVPLTSYVAPAPAPVVPEIVYAAPAPAPVVPLTSYAAPAPAPVVPLTSYAAPAPAPVVPLTSYAAPAPVPLTTYEPPAPAPLEEPVVTYGIPGTTYGEPISNYVANTGQFGYGGFGGGWRNRGFGGLYGGPGLGLYNSGGLGFGFRKHIGFSKGFGFFG